MDCSTPGLPVPHYLLELVQVHVHCISDAVQPSHLLTPSSQSFPVSGTFPMSYLFTSDDQKYWSFSFSISPFSEYSGLITLKIAWFNLLAVQGTFRSLLQHHSSKASILYLSAFFMVKFSQSRVTTGKTVALTLQTFVSRVMSLLFNTLSRFVIAFLPRSNCLLISWLQSPSTVIFGAQEEETCHSFHFPLLFAMQ